MFFERVEMFWLIPIDASSDTCYPEYRKSISLKENVDTSIDERRQPKTGNIFRLS